MLHRRLIILAAIGLGCACSESYPQAIAEPGPPVVDARGPNVACAAPRPPSGLAGLELAYEGFASPVDIVARRDTIYIVEMKGRVKTIDRASGKVKTVLDLIGKVGTLAEQGVLALALHPTKPLAFLTVERDADATTAADKPFRSEILSFAISADGTFDPASEQVVLRLDRPADLHYAGTLKFGPDGFLYIGVGDGGSNYAPEVTAYNPNQLLGSILRIDVDREDVGLHYSVPTDNPFVAGGGRPEIWAGGLRNPWRFSFDRLTGDLWAGDVGENTYEEIDKIEKGKNYGWPILEGVQCFKPAKDCDTRGLAAPFYAYKHTDGGSVTGGFVYRGTRMPALTGKYIFGDYRLGRVFALDVAGGASMPVLLNPGGPGPNMSSFGEDLDGELYVLGWTDGKIWRLVAAVPDASPTLPTLLSRSGCVDPSDATRPAAGVVPYDVNVELWSDGAAKQRFFAIPDGKTIDVGPDGDFAFPEGSVTMKTFSIGGRPIETRLMFRYAGGTWTGASYEWNEGATDATRLDEGKEKLLPGGQTWSFPSPAQCLLCHTIGAGMTLGLETLQLNRDREWAPARTDNQLTRLSALGYLTTPVDPATKPRLPELEGTAPLEDRARGYLHANCAGCHRPSNNVGVYIDLRYGGETRETRPYIGGCNSTNFEGRSDIMILSPGAPSKSALYLRMAARGVSSQMPPLGTHLVDTSGAAVIESWIRSVGTCEQ